MLKIYYPYHVTCLALVSPLTPIILPIHIVDRFTANFLLLSPPFPLAHLPSAFLLAELFLPLFFAFHFLSPFLSLLSLSFIAFSAPFFVVPHLLPMAFLSLQLFVAFPPLLFSPFVAVRLLFTRRRPLFFCAIRLIHFIFVLR